MLKLVAVYSSVGGFGFFAQLAANDANSDYVARWTGPVLTSLANVVGTLFAYLTVRDSKKFDASRLVLEHELKTERADHAECMAKCKQLIQELSTYQTEQKKRYDELWNEMHGTPGERRKNQKPGSPRRRRDDKGSRETPLLSDEPQEPDSPDSEPN